jgi:hypothetical protein
VSFTPKSIILDMQVSVLGSYLDLSAYIKYDVDLFIQFWFIVIRCRSCLLIELLSFGWVRA